MYCRIQLLTEEAIIGPEPAFMAFHRVRHSVGFNIDGRGVMLGRSSRSTRMNECSTAAHARVDEQSWSRSYCEVHKVSRSE